MLWKKWIATLATASLLLAGQANPFATPIRKDQQIEHALERLSFGPRPGEYEQVKQMGLKNWIDLQLHPERITENPELQAKLAPLDSLRMSPLEVVQHYPQPQTIRAIANGRQKMPEDPVMRAGLARVLAKYRVRKNLDKDASKDASKDPDEELEPAKPLDQILEAEQIQTLRQGKPEEKRAVLASIKPDQLDDALIAMPQPLRNQLFNVANPEVKRKLLMLRAPAQVVAYDLLEAKVLRATYSNRQLAEELDDFWYNHFNVFYDKGADRAMVPTYERDAIRPNVLGHFRDLLEATAKSPAMLFYLDNFQSVRPDLDMKVTGNKPRRGLNENYGRELLELHTLGVNGGYTQKDVIAVARCFTGWTIDRPQLGATFKFNDKVHDKGEKVVLGHVIPAGGGMDDGEKVLDILAQHPSTAKFISRKLATRFVSDNPPQALVDRMAQTFLKTNGDIREVMRTMLNSGEFWSAGAYRAKVKTPFEMVVSSVRALNANVSDAFALANQIGQLGEPLYRKLEPTGYSAANSEWVNSAALLGRMNFALNLAQNKVPGVRINQARFEHSTPDQVAQMLLVRNLSPQTKATIDKAVADKPPAPQPAMVAGLVLGSPEFQRK